MGPAYGPTAASTGFPKIDVQISGADLKAIHQVTVDLARQIHGVPGVSDTLVPQDIDAPALRIDVDRVKAAELGLSGKANLQELETGSVSARSSS